MREGAKFCTNCGADLFIQPKQGESELHDPIPLLSPIRIANGPSLWEVIQSLWHRFWATSATKQPYKIIAGVGGVILILMVLVAASPSNSTVSSSDNIHNTPLPTMQAKATVIPNTPKQTPKATPKPTTTPTPTSSPSTDTDMSYFLTQGMESDGYVMASPFTREINVYGHYIYTGVGVKDGHTYGLLLEQVPSINEANARFNEMISYLKNQGYSETSYDGRHWTGTNYYKLSVANLQFSENGDCVIAVIGYV